MALKITTINCKGLRDSNKRDIIFNRCKQTGTDILFVQEAHIVNSREIKIWNQQWGGPGFWSFGSEHSRGVGILLHKQLDFEMVHFKHDFEGRLLVLDINISDCKLRLINVYCPNNEKERKEFLENLQFYLACSRKVILGGDFNFVEDLQLDKEGGDALSGNVGVQIMRDLKFDFSLVDPFRKKYPARKSFTFSQNNVFTRLDRFYVSSELLDSIEDCFMSPCSKSDHQYCELYFRNFDPSTFKYGPGFWKCNVSVLNDLDLQRKITHLWEGELAVKQVKNGIWWEECKVRFRQVIVDYCKQISSRDRQRILELEKEISFWQLLHRNSLHGRSFETEINRAKGLLNDFISKKREGVKIRARAQYIEGAEKPTRYFLRREKQVIKRRTIVKLHSDKGVVTSSGGILNTCREFYKDLYGKVAVDNDLVEHFVGGLPKLSEEERESCEGFLTTNECLLALRRMKNGKTPGGDGLPKEFYVKFFHLFGEDFVGMINDCYLLGELTESQRVGIITLLCKKWDMAHLLGYWRPISLLNVDYKIVSKTLSLRLRGVLGSIIHSDQTCAVMGRSILNSVHTLRNVYDYCDQKDLKYAFVNIDQSKAFDRVSHEFLFKVLQAFGFGPSFINWIRLLYNNISSVVLANGFTSNSFPVERSVRQGCSLSPMLYVLCIEPFACRIRSDPHISGLTIPGMQESIKIVQYADDNTIIVKSPMEVQKVFTVSELYGLASGAKINREKSCGFWLGGWKNREDKLGNIDWQPVVKLLGYRFAHKDLYKENWKPVLDKFSKALQDWKFRNTSFRGRAVLAEVMGASKIWYLGGTLDMPNKFITDFNSKFYKFLWRDKVECLKRDTMIRPYFDGGVGAIDIESKLHAFRILHVKELIYGERCKWHALGEYWIGFELRKFKSELGSNLRPHSVFRPKFYDEVIKSLDLLFTIKSDFDLEQATAKNLYWTFVEHKMVPSKLMIGHPTLDFNVIFSNLFNDFVSPDLRDLNFKIANNILPVGDFLYKRGISVLVSCVFCGYKVESVDHLFVSCPFLKKFWFFIQEIVYHMFGYKFQLVQDIIIFHKIPDNFPEEEDQVIFQLLSLGKYSIWFSRNRKKFDKVSVSVQDIIQLFLRKLRSRCIVDGFRLSLEDFVKRWSKGRVVANITSFGMVDFLL